jgi:NAD(P)-dependent dehydrogenase (short-subunit alcohol dehydrogenase family)
VLILVDFDLADPKGASDAVQALTNQDGAPDGVVLNAGITTILTSRSRPPARGTDRIRGLLASQGPP